MQLAFRRLTPDSPEIGRVICLATGGSLYHVEAIFASGSCFSANAPEGVRFLPSLPQDDACHWLKVRVPWPETPNVLDWCEDQVGEKYDYEAALNSAIGIPRRNPGKWFCSEIVAEICSRCGWCDAPAMPNPVALYRALCAKLGLVPELQASARANAGLLATPHYPRGN